LTREGLDGEPEGGWRTEQTIDLETAIRAYTSTEPNANIVEHNRGPITPEMYATLVLSSENFFKVPAEKIKNVKVEWTIGRKQGSLALIQRASSMGPTI